MSAGNDSFFADTNVLLYALNANEPEKQRRAHAWLVFLWNGAAGRVSWQVIHEFYSSAVRKLGLPPATARKTVGHLMEWHPEQPSFAAIQRAWHWCDKAQINFWDALILAAAEQAGCRYLLTEDFQPGQRFGPVTIVNPFHRDPAEFQ